MVNGYTDSSFQIVRDNSASQSGFMFGLNEGVVSWKSSKQATVADSTMEVEYIAACEEAKEAVCIKISSQGLVWFHQSQIPSIFIAITMEV